MTPDMLKLLQQALASIPAATLEAAGLTQDAARKTRPYLVSNRFTLTAGQTLNKAINLGGVSKLFIATEVRGWGVGAFNFNFTDASGSGLSTSGASIDGQAVFGHLTNVTGWRLPRPWAFGGNDIINFWAGDLSGAGNTVSLAVAGFLVGQ